MAEAIHHTLSTDEPWKVTLFAPDDGRVVAEVQRESYWAAREEVVLHARQHFQAPYGRKQRYRLLWSIVAPYHERIQVQEDTAEGKIVCKIGEIAPSWMTSHSPDRPQEREG